MADTASTTALEIPGYRVEHELGQGGMARVYLAVQESLEREVALKVLSTELVSDPEFCQRFLKEGRTLAKLTHPHVVTIYDSGEHQGIYYMSMELIRGGTLEDSIAANQLTLPRIVEYLKQVAEALEWSHGKGLVHRDIKPANVLFRDDHHAVLTDFGIAKSMAQNTTRMTAVGLAIGTPAYMSPEQAQGQQLTPRSDQYSLGVMLFEMLTGSVPFTGDTSVSVALQHLHTPVPALPEPYGPLQPVVEKMMAKDPEHRFNTLEEMVAALEHACSAGGTARTTEVIPQPALTGTRARPILLAAAGVVIGAVFLAGVAYFALDGQFSSGGEQVADGGGELDPETRQKTQKWLEIAQTHFNIGRLTAPPGNNAMEAYREVLELDAGNEAAQQGLERIAQTYVQLARETLEQGERQESETLVREGLEAFPDHQDLRSLQERLSEG